MALQTNQVEKDLTKMEWIKYQMATFDQWVTYSENGKAVIAGIVSAMFWGFIALNECGII